MNEHVGEELVLLNAVTNAQRRLLDLRRREEATDVLVELVRALGGTVIPAHLAPADGLHVDLTFGASETLVPSAPPGSPARARLERLLPSLVEQARGILRLLDASGMVDRLDTTDLLTGLSTRDHLLRIMQRSGDGDRLLGFAIDRPRAITETYGRARLDVLVHAMAQLVSTHVHPADHAARVGPGSVAILAIRGDEDQLDQVERVVVGAWAERRTIDVELLTASVEVTQPVKEALRALDRQLDQPRVDDRRSR